MKLSGEEKTIQALFHELKSEDDIIAPSFTRTWNIAQARSNRARSWAVLKTFPKLPRLPTAFVIVAFVVAAIVLWARLLQPNQQSQDSLAKQLPNDPVHTLNRPAEGINGSGITKSEKPNRSIVGPRRLKPVGRALAASRLRKVKEIELSRWQSPTAGLLKFPGDELLKNNPALNQSVHEMRGFLSNWN